MNKYEVPQQFLNEFSKLEEALGEGLTPLYRVYDIIRGSGDFPTLENYLFEITPEYCFINQRDFASVWAGDRKAKYILTKPIMYVVYHIDDEGILRTYSHRKGIITSSTYVTQNVLESHDYYQFTQKQATTLAQSEFFSYCKVSEYQEVINFASNN